MKKQSIRPDLPFLERFQGREISLIENEPAWLRAARQAGLNRFSELGFPTPQQEEWRNTNVASIAKGLFRPTERETLSIEELPALARLDLGGPRIVLVDGYFDPTLSRVDDLEKGLQISSLASWLAQDPEAFRSWISNRESAAPVSAFRALNAGLFQDGVLIHVDRRALIERPVQLFHVASGTDGDGAQNATHTRVRIKAESSSRFALVESYVSLRETPHLTNAVTEIDVAQDAVMHHDRVQLESAEAYHVASVDCRQHANSFYDSRHFSFGGRLVRNDLRGTLLGEGGNCTMDGLYVTRGSQHVDHHTVLDHASPHCDSRELFKGILFDRSRTVFSGRIIVRQDAQKTDAKQSNPNLVLSDLAMAHTRPQLEIYADDVRCTHGATVGQLDRDAIFYLRSRGLPEMAARNLMTEAFAGEVLSRVSLDPLREHLEKIVNARLSGA